MWSLAYFYMVMREEEEEAQGTGHTGHTQAIILTASINPLAHEEVGLLCFLPHISQAGTGKCNYLVGSPA